MFIKILSAIGKHLSLTQNLKTVFLNNINLDKKIINIAKGK